MDWTKAEAWLTTVERLYTEIGTAGYLALTYIILPLRDRFNNGERTQELHDTIMSLE